MFFNFEEIKADNPIDEIAERLGIDLTKSGASMRGKCPVCESSGDRNLAVTPSKGVWYCFTQGKGGDCIALVAHVKGIGVKEAAEWIVGPVHSKSAKEKKPSKQPSEGFAPLDYLDPAHEAVLALGFDPDDAERIGAGYAPRGILRGKVAIPVRDGTGKLLGYVGVQDVQLPPKWSW